MLPCAALVWLLTTLSTASPIDPTSPSQNVLDLSHARPQAGNPRKLRGKFLHITDIHPDPFYKPATDPNGEHPCHAGNGSAGYFGAQRTECDTPFSLIDATFDWIKHNVKDDIDFIIWTGDSARHDNDELHPRTTKQVEDMNHFVVSKFNQVFGKPKTKHDPDPTNHFVVPIVPTFGNNDILPHNIFEPGPNKWTKKYLSIWEKFIPQEQRHSFARGGWFYTEVIPNKLAVFSLNTLYFFDSNAAVDGCDMVSQPGYEHFEWLRIQLDFLRRRKMKAILIGHVPPARTATKESWDETCYQKYNLWLRQYRDVIVGNIFGHMNMDHFALQDVRELTYKFKIKGIDDEGLRDRGSSISAGLQTQAKTDYLSDLRALWSRLPSPPHGSSYATDDLDVEPAGHKKKKKGKPSKHDRFLREIGGPYGERFSLSIVAPSIVPNFYPSLRIVEYNISGLKHDHPALVPTAPTEFSSMGPLEFSEQEGLVDDDDKEDYIVSDAEYGIEKNTKKKNHKKKKKKKKKKQRKPKPNFRVPDPPSKSSPPGPGYSPQPLSFISWTQYYANLTKINKAVADELHDRRPHSHDDTFNDLQEETMKKHFSYEVGYNTANDSSYRMKDMTVLSWLDYAEKISRSKFNLKTFDPDKDHGFNDEQDDLSTADESRLEYGNFTTVGNEADLAYDSASHDETDDDDDDDFENDSGDDDNDDMSPTKYKKPKKRKQASLKKNHLWHRFVRRAYVGAKSWEELMDEFG